MGFGYCVPLDVFTLLAVIVVNDYSYDSVDEVEKETLVIANEQKGKGFLASAG